MAGITPPLRDGQFRLGGLKFGLATDEIGCVASGFHLGGHTWRDSDVEVGDRVLVGADHITPGSITFKFFIRRYGDVWSALDQLQEVWRADATRRTPGKTMALEYAAGGRGRVLYGRPRQFEIDPQETWDDDFATAAAQFKLTDPNSYDAVEVSQTVVERPPSTAWYQLPGRWSLIPWGRPGRRDGILENGPVAVPFRVEVHGHDTNTGIPVITGDGWKFRFRDVLPRGHVAVVDTAAAVVTIDGEPTLTGLTADSRIRAVLPPGRSEVRVTGADRAVVWWRRGYPSI